MELCQYQFFRETYDQPAEYCINAAEDGMDFCSDHDPELGEPDWDSIAKDRSLDCE